MQRTAPTTRPMNLLTRLAVALALPSIFAASFSAPQPLPAGQAVAIPVLLPHAAHGAHVVLTAPPAAQAQAGTASRGGWRTGG